mmetsp:Transcript_8328/g.25034  ORF Transcript_8328/g.25034 Transcript_8328/m.25034 type:complete len:181 (-) Transcript_8328:11-553(-)
MLARLKSLNCSSKILGIIYVYDDPVDAILSLYRRNYIVSHPRHTQSSSGTSFKIPDTIEQYAEGQQDVFELTYHVVSYIRLACSKFATYPVVFIRSSTAHQHLEELMKIIGIDPEERMPKVPEKYRGPAERSARKFYKEQMGEQYYDVLYKIESIYGGLRWIVDKLGDFKIMKQCRDIIV